MNLLDVKNLEVTFGAGSHRVSAVRGVSFFLRQGERLGIVGESGCGKSATAKALIKLLPPLLFNHGTSHISWPQPYRDG